MGRKKGQYTVESWMIATGKAGAVFYSDKEDRHIAAIAVHHKRTVKTERVIIITGHNSASPKAHKITKVTLL